MGWKRRSSIAGGGIVGAALRWAILTSVASPGRIPWPVLGINVAGSLLLGVLLAEEWDHPRARLLLHDLGGIGFCGGLTTFSTFAVEIVDLVRDDAVGDACSRPVRGEWPPRRWAWPSCREEPRRHTRIWAAAASPCPL